jgi:hypothetical protein
MIEKNDEELNIASKFSWLNLPRPEHTFLTSFLREKSFSNASI